MSCIIEGTDFFELECMRYYAPPASWPEDKKKTNAESKIFSGDWLGSQKRDGCLYMFCKDMDGNMYLRPRSRNVKKEFVNKINWVPHLHAFFEEIDPGTVFLGELYLPRDEQAKSSSSIMNCLENRAIARQKNEEDRLHYYIFDILAENGKSYLDWKAEDRFDLLNSFSRAYPYPYVEWAWYKDGKELWDLLQNLLADGYEGVVITHKNAKYQPGARSNKVSLKIKKEIQETIDCVIMGANPPTKLSGTKEPETWEWWYDELTGERILAKEYFEQNHESIYKKYADGATVVPVTKAWFYGWAGSLKLGLYDGDKVIHVGDLSGISDEIRQNWKDYVGTVVEISCMEITENQQGGWGFRHPKAIAFNRDKPPKECTLNQIK